MIIIIGEQVDKKLDDSEKSRAVLVQCATAGSYYY